MNKTVAQKYLKLAIRATDASVKIEEEN